jgi:hypothetical protein
MVLYAENDHLSEQIQYFLSFLKQGRELNERDNNLRFLLILKLFRRVSEDMRALLFTTRETVAMDTPACLATSFIVEFKTKPLS